MSSIIQSDLLKDYLTCRYATLVYIIIIRLYTYVVRVCTPAMVARIVVRKKKGEYLIKCFFTGSNADAGCWMENDGG